MSVAHSTPILKFAHTKLIWQAPRQGNDVTDFIFHGTTEPSDPRPPHYWGFTITLRHTTVDKTPLDEWPARRRDLCLTTHNTHNRKTFMLRTGFEPAIPASERQQTHALDSY